MRAMVSMDPATWSYETKASIYCAAILAERGELPPAGSTPECVLDHAPNAHCRGWDRD